MRRRALLHVSGLPGAGKTTFIESLVAANDDDAFLVVRAWHDAKLRAPKITSDVREVERAPNLARYLRAGAMTGWRCLPALRLPRRSHWAAAQRAV